jgi:hypothetical protein
MKVTFIDEKSDYRETKQLSRVPRISEKIFLDEYEWTVTKVVTNVCSSEEYLVYLLKIVKLEEQNVS